MKLSKKILRNVNVLHIEDNIQITNLIKEELKLSENTKFTVTNKSNLSDGIKYIKKLCKTKEDCSIDVIILDLILPNSKGVNTFLRLKKVSGDIPIVIVSAHKDIACECVSLGAQDYLVKPDIPGPVLIRSLKYAIQRNIIEQTMKNVIMTSTLGYHLYEMIDDKLILIGYNPTADRLLKIKHKQFLDKDLFGAFPNLPDEIVNKCKDALNGTPWVDQVIPYQDNNVNPIYLRVNAYRTGPGRLAITFDDISKHIYQEAALKESGLKYRTLVEATRAAIFGLSFKGNKFTYVNDVFRNYLHYTEDEMLKINVADTLSIESRLVYRQRRLALKLGHQIPSTCEYEILKKDGSTMWLFTTADYIEDSDGIVAGANVVAIDITQKKIAELEAKEKEREGYSQLEQQIKNWNDEISESHAKKEEALKLIDNEIITMRETFQNEVNK